MTTETNLWVNDDHVEEYLERRATFPHRLEGYGVLEEVLPSHVERFLDLGTGDGELVARVLEARPTAVGVGTDFNAGMLERAQARFADDERVEFRSYDFNDPLPDLGKFDLVVSAFAIHHTPDDRKRALYGELFAALRAGGVFVNLEHVASATPRLHQEFLDALAVGDDPSNLLAPVETQLEWLRAFGFDDVDCLWKWREMAVLFGRKPR